MKFALLEATVPSSIGTQDYTHPDVTDFDSANGALAIVLAGGDGNDEDGTGSISVATVCGGGSPLAVMSAQAGSGRTTNAADRQQSAVADTVHIYGPAISGTDAFRAIGTATRLPDGLRIDWTDVSGVTGGRDYKFVIAFVFGAGFKCEGTLSNSTAGAGFDGVDAVLHQSRGIGFGSSLLDHAHVALGGAVNGSPIRQAAAAIAFRGGSVTTTASRGYARDDSVAVNLTGTPPETPNAAEVTAFGTVDATVSNLVGAPNLRRVYLRSAARRERDFGVALETLDGTTGSKHLTGLGIRPGLVLGMIAGVDTLATVQSGAARAFAGVFVTDGIDTFCFSIAQDDGAAISGGSPTVGYSRRSSSLNVIGPAGATVFAASVDELSDQGLRLTVTTGLVGQMFLFGFAAENIVPEPAVMGFAVPAVTRVGNPSPSPVAMGFAPAAPVLSVPLVPAPAVLELEVPATELVTIENPTLVETVRSPLVEPYARALLDLLPRGIAWTRSLDSVLGRLLLGFARELELLDYRTQDLLAEADPRLTHELLPEWEAFLRTRIDCPDLGATEIERRFAVLLRLAQPGGQSPFHYSEAARALGYEIAPEDFEALAPFRVGTSPCNYPLRDDQWAHVVLVHAPVVSPIFFRVGLSTVGEPLTTANNDRLECELDRIKPAHVLFLYAYDRPYSGFSPWSVLGPAPAEIRLAVPVPRIT